MPFLGATLSFSVDHAAYAVWVSCIRGQFSKCAILLPAGMPVSSTHCQIGSIVAVGIIESGPKSVQWNVLSKIVVAWVVTVPLAAVVAAMLLAALRPILSL